LYPKFHRAKQHFDCTAITNVEAEIKSQFQKSDFVATIKPGDRIAVAVGSRGIANISTIVKNVIEELKKLKAAPFIVPAMGSHGGATAEGQEAVLKSLGITEEMVGAAVCSSMEVEHVGSTADGVPVYLDTMAAGADGIFLINRIKAHTDFNAPIESGLVKMIAIGLANHKGCSTLHQYGLSHCIPRTAKVVLDRGYIKGGLAILENSRDETALLEILKAEEFFVREEVLLKQAKALMPKIPFSNLDVLVVKRIGKKISGTGMDTKVIGRLRVEGLPEPAEPAIKRIVVLELADDSYGNALGIGLADLTTKRLVDRIDYKVMYANVLPTSYLERGKIPVVLDSDRLALEAALESIGPVVSKHARVCIIKNTLELEEMYISESLVPELASRNDIEILGELEELPFSEHDELMLFS
jgi:hypothetical protein